MEYMSYDTYTKCIAHYIYYITCNTCSGVVHACTPYASVLHLRVVLLHRGKCLYCYVELWALTPLVHALHL